MKSERKDLNWVNVLMMMCGSTNGGILVVVTAVVADVDVMCGRRKEKL